MTILISTFTILSCFFCKIVNYFKIYSKKKGFGTGIALGLLNKMTDHLKVCGGETKQQLTVNEL